ncbi:hypothetical protein MUTS16_57780 [Escherichia coli]|nr:hypothetical protein MUTS16_57780 [Escherichia coli]
MKGKTGPVMAKTRILRAYSGVRPLVASDDDPSGRNVSRGIVLLDHAERDGLDGFITITGGKLMTYRLMAEWATDAVCRKLGNTRPVRPPIWHFLVHRNPLKLPCVKSSPYLPRCAVLRFIVMAIARLPG